MKYIFKSFIIIIAFLNFSLANLCIEADANSKNCPEPLCFEFIGCDDNQTCLYQDLDISDDIQCTVDMCDDVLGAYYIPHDELCPPENLCYKYYCDIESGCVAISKVECQPPNMCQTLLGCNRENGNCTYLDIDCDDGNDCSDDLCNPLTGCYSVLNHSNCEIPSNLSLCVQNGYCTETGCEHQVTNCDDNNPCTDDYCNTEIGCVSTLNDDNCMPQDSCHTSVCTAQGCIQIPINCSDGNPCSDDRCIPGIGCQSTLNNTNCLTNNKCLNSTCTANGCLSSPIVCNDGNPCSDDTCNPTIGCQSTLNNALCDDGKKCTIDQCTANGCTHQNVTCPSQPILIGLICRNYYCEPSSGNCVLDMNSVSLLCL